MEEMKATIFEKCMVLTSGENIDRLDEMLTSYGVEHSFALPPTAVFVDHPAALIMLHFLEKDMMTTYLVCALFCNVYRKVDDEKLGGVLVKIGSHFELNEPVRNVAF